MSLEDDEKYLLLIHLEFLEEINATWKLHHTTADTILPWMRTSTCRQDCERHYGSIVAPLL